MTHFIGILSAKGGVAKTTTAVNLASAFKFFNRDVIVVDGNLSTPNLGLHFGLSNFPITLNDVLRGKNDIVEAIYSLNNGVKIIPGSLSVNSYRGVNPGRLSNVLPKLEGLSEIVVVDASAGLGSEALATMKAVDNILVVTSPEIPSVTDALKNIKIAEQMNKNILGVLVTRSGNQYDLDFGNIEAILDKDLIGAIPEDRSMRKSLVMSQAVVDAFPKSESAIAYKKLAASLIGVGYHPEKAGFIEKLRLWSSKTR